MPSHYDIRPAFIVSYIDRHRAGWAERNEVIATNDAEIRELNRSHGFVNPDGSIPLGCRFHVDAAYKAKYDRLRSAHDSRYAQITVREDERDRAEGMTIYEYLLLKDILSDADAKLYSAAKEAGERGYADFIRIRAKADAENLAVGNTIAGAAKAVRSTADNFRYALKRCRSFFGVSLFDVGAHLAMHRYRAQYVGELEDVARTLRVAGQ